VLRVSAFIQPCEPTLRDRLPKGEGWLYEVKFDGYRMQIQPAARSRSTRATAPTGPNAFHIWPPP
jgi:ATP-dependent DNA ligase